MERALHHAPPSLRERVEPVRKLLCIFIGAALVLLFGVGQATAASDRIPPTAPASLIASAVTQTSVRLTWTKSTDNIGVNYYVIYKIFNGQTSRVDSTTSSLSYVVTGLSASTAYSFFIKAGDRANNLSPASPIVAVQTLAIAPPPPPPPPPSFWSNCPNGYVGLTFDDGPGSGTSLTVSTLNQFGIRATFFDVGANVLANSTYALTQYSGGSNVIADHTYDHQSFTGESTGTARLTDAQMRSEIQNTINVEVSIGLPAPTLFRYPYGDRDTATDAIVSSFGLVSVGWTTDTNDWAGPSSAVIATRVLSAVSGGVVLMHDGRSNTTGAIPAIASGLQSQGRCPGRIVYSSTPQTVWSGWDFYATAVAW